MSRALLVAAVACSVGCAGAGPKRVTTRTETERIALPFPVGEPVKEQSGPRLQLAAATFGLLADDGSLIGAYVRPDDETYQAVIALVPRLDRTRQSVTDVSTEALTAAGVDAPSDSGLLLSAQGVCRAAIGAPSLHLDPEAAALQIRWALEGCDGGATAPVLVLVQRLAEELRWVPATRTVDLTLPVGAEWADRRASMIETPTWGGGGLPTARVISAWEVADVSPPVLQVYDALVAMDGAEPNPCTDRDAWAQTNAFDRQQWLDPLEPTPEPTSVPQLLGAIGHEGLLDAIVFRDRDAIAVAVPPATTPDGSETPWAYHLVGPEDPTRFDAPWGFAIGTGQAQFLPRCRGTDLAGP